MTYIKIVYNIYNNYEIKNRNFQILQNIIHIKDSNHNIINDINSIIIEKDIITKFAKIMKIYSQMINKEEKKGEYIKKEEKIEIQNNLKDMGNINNKEKINKKNDSKKTEENITIVFPSFCIQIICKSK